MERDQFENYMNELLTNELTSERVLDIVTEVKNEYNSLVTINSEQSSEISKLMERNADLVATNGKLFLQIGKVENNEEKENEEKEIEFSEKITIEDLED